MAEYRIAWLFGIVLVFTAVGILLVFKARGPPRINKPLIPNPAGTNPSDLQKAPLLSRESSTVSEKQTTRPSDHGQREPVEGASKPPYSKFAMGISLLIPCTLLVLVHLRMVMAVQSHYRSLERPLLQTMASSGLQEVFQVYQPVSLSPKETSGEANSCDGELLLMDHVFGSSYGVPFVGG